MASELQRAITVGELIAALSKCDPSLPVGRAGHFGEFNAYRKRCAREARSEAENWTLTRVPEFAFVSIEAPDIGEEPD